MLNAFRAGGRKKGTGIVVWALLGLLIIGLTGLGLGGAVSSLASQNVARVGDEPVGREEFVRAMFRQFDVLAQTTRQRPTMQQAREMGLDRQVLSNLISEAALDVEAREMGISVGDAVVRDQLLDAPMFQGISGGFDPQAYEFFLDRQGLSASEYEEEMRDEAARTMIRVAVADGTDMPDLLSRTLLDYAAEQRGFRYAVVGPDALDGEIAAPDDAALRAHYEANPDAYTLPETRNVTYVALTPDAAAEAVEIDDDRIRALYDERSGSYATPERRAVDVIAFPDQDAATAAKARLDAGEIGFDALAEERGLSAGDLDLGLVEREELAPAARDAVFGASEPGIVGPVQSDLGPALYRLNAILEAQTRSFEDVEDELRAEIAGEAARAEIDRWIEPVQDLLASGATLEDVAAETPLTLGTLGLTDAPGDGLAGDRAFRAEALEAEPGEFRDLIDLGSGGIAALRIDEIVPPMLQPFEDVADTVEADWRAEELGTRLVALAEELKSRVEEGRTLDAVASDAGLDVETQEPVERGARLPAGLPPELLSDLFDLGLGDVMVSPAPNGALLIQLSDILPFDPAADDNAARVGALDASLSDQLSTDLFIGYLQLLRDRAGIQVNDTLIAETLAQYP